MFYTLIGAKAANLIKMHTRGINVPKLICIEDTGRVPEAEEIMKQVDAHLGDCELFSVRSSSSAEDSADSSFAGQFDTYLNVKRCDIPEYVGRCMLGGGEALNAYCENKGVKRDDIRVNVIIQQMIEADKSGVLFTANPMGILNEAVIVVGNGTGNNVVEDKVPVTTYYYNLTDSKYFCEAKPNAPSLSVSEIETLITDAKRIEKLFCKYMDIEFAVKGNDIYILQARPITTLDSSSTVTLDNSNIVESYPGITLPLTEGFVNRMYTGVFRSMISRLIKDEELLTKYEAVFDEMTASANGRMYYKIDNWYRVLKLLPCGEKIIPVWQDMLGVSEKSVDAEAAVISKKTKAAEALRFIHEMLHVKKSNKRLDKKFREIEINYKNTFNESISVAEMKKLYDEIEGKLLGQWDVTLLNDLYTFIYAGLLKALLKKAGVKNYVQKANDCISNVTNLESMKPVRALAQISLAAAKSGRLSDIGSISNNEQAAEFLTSGCELAEMMNEYIDCYGDRYLEELKLESKTFRTDPVLLFSKVAEYGQSSRRLNKLVCGNAYKSKSSLEGIKVGVGYRLSLKFIVRKETKGIACREISRLNRSRVFGMVRTLFIAAGKQLEKSGAIEKTGDVFYLTPDEVFNSGGVVDFKATVRLRRQKYESFAEMPAFSRLVFTGKEFSKSPMQVSHSSAVQSGGTLSGTPCSSGTVEGEVLVIESPDAAIDCRNKILVAKMTDPGWVFLLANAKGIISEKGSMLSHTAIISRELGITAVVGVNAATTILKSGDRVRISGDSGEITILNTEVKKYA